MTIHEFGKENEKVVVLILPSIVMWDYFEYVIPLLEKNYHLIIPALPGYDPDKKGNFTSVEAISRGLERWLIKNDQKDVACMYGCSMGGSIVTRMLADNALNIGSAVIDGGITPYQMPWICFKLRRMLLLYRLLQRDTCCILFGVRNGIRDLFENINLHLSEKKI